MRLTSPGHTTGDRNTINIRKDIIINVEVFNCLRAIGCADEAAGEEANKNGCVS